MAVVTVLSCGDLLVDPEVFKELEHIFTHTVTVALQGPDEEFAVYSFLVFPKCE